MPRLLWFLFTSTTLLVATQTSLASDSADESVGLASEPLPAFTRNRCLTDSEVAAFAQLLRGENVSEVFQTLGQPDEIVFANGANIQLSYCFGHQLVVTIREGQVCSVGSRVMINREEQERQTGVREDDFVGPVGP